MIELPFITELALQMISGVSGVIGIGQYASHIINTKRERNEISTNFHKQGYWLSTVPELQESSQKTIDIIDKVTPLINRLQFANAVRYGIKSLFTLLVLLLLNYMVMRAFLAIPSLGEGWVAILAMVAISIFAFVFTAVLVHRLNFDLPQNAKILTEMTTGKLSEASQKIVVSKDRLSSKIDDVVEGFGYREMDANEKKLITAYTEAIYLIRSIEAVHAKKDLDSAMEQLKEYGNQLGINVSLTSASSGRAESARR